MFTPLRTTVLLAIAAEPGREPGCSLGCVTFGIMRCHRQVNAFRWIRNADMRGSIGIAVVVWNMKASYVLSFLCGAAVMMFGFSALRGSNAKSSHHVYELRMYHVNPGKMEALIARFGDHTDALFKRHNMKSIGYWRPEDAPNSENLFVYILEHPSRQAAEKNWADFQADPDWKKVKAESEKNGALVDHIDHYFMDPTSYSTLQ